MPEQTIMFGSGEQSLAGILTTADSDRALADAPHFILLNAGLIHRVGPNRLYVDIARSLADVGVNTLRFDLSGIGDSETAKSNQTLVEMRLGEVREAIDAMAGRFGSRRCVLGGLCSGAGLSFGAATRDPDVAGLVMMDPFGYRSMGYFVRRFRTKIFQLSSWKNLLSGNHLIWKVIKRRREDQRQFSQRLPAKKEVEQELLSLLDRGTQAFVAYAGELINHRRQFKEMFPSVAGHTNMEMTYYAMADHTFVLRKYQQMLISDITRWYAAQSWKDNSDQSA